MKFSASDALVLTGFSGIGYGLWLIYPPLTFLAVGSACVFVGVWLQRRSARKEGGN